MSTMTDEEYREGKAIIERAEELGDSVFEEARRRGDVFTLHAWFYGSKVQWHFVTLKAALGRAGYDCRPESIIGPDGTQYDPYAGEIEETNA